LRKSNGYCYLLDDVFNSGVGQIDEDFKIFLLGGLCAYAVFVMVFHYLLIFFTKDNVWKLAFRILGHDLVDHLVVWHTGKQKQPVT